jgi:endonuclease YncB( thermonuclease family)
VLGVRRQPRRPLLLVATALALLTAGCGAHAEPATAPPAASLPSAVAKVDYVNDGDTLTLSTGKRVRLVQIDAPELYDDCYGKAARAALRRLVPNGSSVVLIRDPALDATDKYGRILRYVLSRGVNVNEALVRRGSASPYFFRGERGVYAGALLDAAHAARAAKRGFWGSCPGARLDTGIGSITGPA